MTDVAVAWVEALVARGVTLTVRNNRLSMHPPSAYSALSDEELLTLRHNREAIKAVVREGGAQPPTPTAGHTSFVAPAEVVSSTATVQAKARCSYCMRVCVGPEHHAFATLHALDSEFIRKKDIEHREHDREEWDTRRRFGLPSPTWDI